MVFWIGVIVGGLFVVWAIKKGFYETWVTLFNTVIAIYLAIFLRPTVAPWVQEAADTPYNNALIVLVIWVASFAILSGLSYIFFTSQFNVPFPRVLDIIGSGIIGFCNGFLIWSFVCLLITLTPIAKEQVLTDMGFGDKFQKSNATNIKWWVNKVNNLVSSKSNFLSTDVVIADLMKEAEKKEIQRPRTPSTNEPNQISEPNKITEPNKPVEGCPPGTPQQNTPPNRIGSGSGSYNVNPPK
jgi:uncharacterized membrane protein required for colicin V production